MDFCVVLVAAANLKASQSRSLFSPPLRKIFTLRRKGGKVQRRWGELSVEQKRKSGSRRKREKEGGTKAVSLIALVF